MLLALTRQNDVFGLCKPVLFLGLGATRNEKAIKLVSL